VGLVGLVGHGGARQHDATAGPNQADERTSAATVRYARASAVLARRIPHAERQVGVDDDAGADAGEVADDPEAVAIAPDPLHIDHFGPTAPANDPHYRAYAYASESAPRSTLYEEFHPFGTTSYAANDSGIEVSAKRYRYIGKERDEETGLYHLGARYYASWLARWTAADPIGLGDGTNRFAYARGCPTALVDPGGTKGDKPQPAEENQAQYQQRRLDELANAGVPRDEALRTLGEELQQKFPKPKPSRHRVPTAPYSADTSGKDALVRRSAELRQREGAQYDAQRRVEAAVESRGEGAKTIAEVAVGFTPLGPLLDIYDISKAVQSGDKVAIGIAIGGLVLGGFGDVAKGAFRIGDDVIEAGADVSRHVDDTAATATSPRIARDAETIAADLPSIATGSAKPTGTLDTVGDAGARVSKVAKSESPTWQLLQESGRTKKGTITTGTGKKTRRYQWDHTHGDIEVYDSRRRHLGSMHPTTGEMYKPPVPGRRMKP